MNLTLNRDQPYDEFIREQIVGDEVEEIRGLVDCPWGEMWLQIRTFDSHTFR